MGLEARVLSNTKMKTPQHQLGKRRIDTDAKQRAKRAALAPNPMDDLEDEEPATPKLGAKKAGPKKTGAVAAAIAAPAMPTAMTEGEKNYKARQRAKEKSDRIAVMQNKLRADIHAEQE
eukprot:303749_1